MKRRKFFKKGLTYSSGLLLIPSISSPFCANSPSLNQNSKIVLAKHKNLQTKNTPLNSKYLEIMLDKTIQALFDRDNVLEGWKKIVHPGEIIGLKVNCLSGNGSTNQDLVMAICERLKEAGIKENNIVIWDRLNSDLEDGGFRINYNNKGIRCFGNDALGFEQDLEISGSAASLVCKTLTRVCDGVINLPVLKDHGIAGVTIALKNLFGAIHNPNKYHLNVGDPYIPDVYMLPSIRKKIRLTICDAIRPQYEGGPSFMPHWIWQYNGIICGLDPVALDYSGWQIIDRKRAEMGMKSLMELGREPTYISTAADSKHRLGTNDLKKIRLIEV